MKKTDEIPDPKMLSGSIGEFIEYWGYKKIHGVIWTHIYLSPKPLTAGDLISRLGVSKALISLTLKDLLGHGLILQTQDSPARKNKHYQANPDVFGAIRSVLKKRESELISNITKESKALLDKAGKTPTKNHLDVERLKTLFEMSTAAEAALKVIISLPGLNTDLLRSLFSGE